MEKVIDFLAYGSVSAFIVASIVWMIGLGIKNKDSRLSRDLGRFKRIMQLSVLVLVVGMMLNPDVPYWQDVGLYFLGFFSLISLFMLFSTIPNLSMTIFNVIRGKAEKIEIIYSFLVSALFMGIVYLDFKLTAKVNPVEPMTYGELFEKTNNAMSNAMTPMLVLTGFMVLMLVTIEVKKRTSK